MKPDRNAAIAVIQAGEFTTRPGLFVFTTPDGFAWVEPAYLEPAPTREAFHRVRARVTMTAAKGMQTATAAIRSCRVPSAPRRARA